MTVTLRPAGAIAAAGLIALLAAAPGVLAADAATAQPERFDPARVDRATDPCDDFEKFACRRWEDANPIPPDETAWDTSGTLNLWNLNLLRDVLQHASVPRDGRDAVDARIGDFWASCTDPAAVQAASARELPRQWSAIDALKNRRELAGAVARLHRDIPGAWAGGNNQTDAALFGLSSTQDFDDASKVVLAVDQGGLSLPGRDFYLKSDAKSVALREAFRHHVARMLEIAGEDRARAARESHTVLQIETELAAWQMDNVSRRDPDLTNHKLSIGDIAALAPAFDWNAYLAAMQAPATPHYLVGSPDFLRGMDRSLRKHGIEDWKAYLHWRLVHGLAPFLSDALDREDFAFFRRELNGAKEQLPRWRRCVGATDDFLGEALGQAYVARAFPPQSRQMVLEIVHDVEAAMGDDFRQLDWISPPTRQQAQQKLAAIEEKIGYPDHWRDYSSLAISRGDYVGNIERASGFEMRRQLAKVGRPVDRSEWFMTPPTINAYYDPQMNSINFPAGILQPPQFDPAADTAVNYGNIGSTVGHELTHGFDDEGRKFDGAGNLRNWWTEADIQAYEERGRCIASQYTQDVPQAGPGVRQDGRLTQGEDTADNGGTRIALAALLSRLARQGVDAQLKGPDGWTAVQRFFLSYANQWCSNRRPESIRTLVLTNPHSLERFRVNNVLSDMPEFAQAFSCHAGQRMVREPACRVW